MSPFTECKIEKLEKGLEKIDRGSHYNQVEWLEKFLDDISAFYNGIESDDSDNNDENYN